MCVLLVDDDELIREIMSETLTEAGFSVVGAEDGLEALALIEARPSFFTLLITDFNMPGQIDGAVVARRARELAPALPVVIASGRPEIYDARWRTDLNYAFLAKPYRPRELVDLARTLTR